MMTVARRCFAAIVCVVLLVTGRVPEAPFTG